MVPNIKKINWSKIWASIRHCLYLTIYLIAIIAYSINIFPIFILRKFKRFDIPCTIIMGYMLMKFQSIVKLAMLVGGIELYVYKEKDTELLFKNNVVVLPNHLSELDSMYLGSLYSDIFPQDYKVITMPKKSIRYYPFIGWITLAHDAIFVQNNNTEPNKGQYGYIEKKLQIENNNSFRKNIIIFIEGTTFSETVKKRREFFNESLSYNNLLIPRTTGLHMVHSNVDIDGETYITMRFKGDHKIEDYTIVNSFLGIKPKSVHMFLDTKPYVKDVELLKDRQTFDNNVYNNFRTIDEKLDESDWTTKYDCTKLSMNFGDLLYFMVFMVVGGYTIGGLLWSGNYRLYFGIVSLVYTYFGFREV